MTTTAGLPLWRSISKLLRLHRTIGRAALDIFLVLTKRPSDSYPQQWNSSLPNILIKKSRSTGWIITDAKTQSFSPEIGIEVISKREAIAICCVAPVTLARAFSMAVDMIAAVFSWFRARLFIFSSAKPRDLLWMPKIYYFGCFVILRVTMMVRVR
jgi:hypothetical protein